MLDYLGGDLPELSAGTEVEDSAENRAIDAAKIEAARHHLRNVSQRWRTLLESLDQPAIEHATLLPDRLREQMQPGDTLLALLLRRELRISCRHEVARPLKEIFAGREWNGVAAQLDAIHSGSAPAACSSPRICMPATATCIPIFRSTPTIIHAA